MISASQIGLVGVVGLGVLYKNSDSDTIAKVVAVTVIGSVFGAGLWVAGTVQNAISSSNTYLQGYSDNAKKISSIALGMIAGVGAMALVFWTVLVVLDRH